MPYVIIENFNGGMDTRRMAASSAPGTLIELTNAHITRGGEIEKRKAFDSRYSLPAGTVGMAATKDSLYVFGDGVDPGVPGGVTYQRLQHPSGQSLSRILSWDLYAGKLYVAAEFANGDVYHFYDGTRVETWFDGKARGTFVVQKTGTSAGSKSATSFTIDKDSEELEVTIYMTDPEDPDNPINLTGGTVSVAAGASSSTYASALASAINGETGTTGMEALATSITGLDVLLIDTEDAYENFDGRNIWFEIDEIGIFQANISASPRTPRCNAEGSCTNTVTLAANAESGVAPYTYAWTIVDDGGAAAATLDDATAASPVLTVTNATGGTTACNTVSVAVNVEVTDSAGTPQTVSDTVVINSIHCSPSAYEPPADDAGSTFYTRPE